jgi:hypothetical protein
MSFPGTGDMNMCLNQRHRCPAAQVMYVYVRSDNSSVRRRRDPAVTRADTVRSIAVVPDQWLGDRSR